MATRENNNGLNDQFQSEWCDCDEDDQSIPRTNTLTALETAQDGDKTDPHVDPENDIQIGENDQNEPPFPITNGRNTFISSLTAATLDSYDTSNNFDIGGRGRQYQHQLLIGPANYLCLS